MRGSSIDTCREWIIEVRGLHVTRLVCTLAHLKRNFGPNIRIVGNVVSILATNNEVRI